MDLSQRTGEMKFILYDREYETLVEGVTQLQYISRTLKQMDNYWTELHRNIGKARALWCRLGKLLQRERAATGYHNFSTRR